MITFAVLWIFSTPLTSEALWSWLEQAYQRLIASAVLQKARPSAVVVLGTGRHAAPGSARTIEWTDVDRFFAGLVSFPNFSSKGACSADFYRWLVAYAARSHPGR